MNEYKEFIDKYYPQIFKWVRQLQKNYNLDYYTIYNIVIYHTWEIYKDIDLKNDNFHYIKAKTAKYIKRDISNAFNDKVINEAVNMLVKKYKPNKKIEGQNGIERAKHFFETMSEQNINFKIYKLYYEGYTWKEIAEIMNMNHHTCERRTKRLKTHFHPYFLYALDIIYRSG